MEPGEDEDEYEVLLSNKVKMKQDKINRKKAEQREIDKKKREEENGEVMEDEPEPVKKKTKKRRKKLSEIMIIKQDGSVINQGMVMLPFVAYSCLTVIYRAAFGDYSAIYMIVIDTVVEFTFLIDLVLNFMTTYKDDEQNHVTDHKKIATDYIFHATFLFDFLPIIPLQFILADEL